MVIFETRWDVSCEAAIDVESGHFEDHKDGWIRGNATTMAIITKENAAKKARELFEKGFAAMDRGNLEYAIEMFLFALEFEPGFLDARKYLRTAELKKYKMGNNNPSTQLASSITSFPTLLVARSKLAKKPLQALQMAERLLRNNPVNPMFVYLLCDAAFYLNMPEVAVQTLEILRDFRPNNIEVQLRLGEAYEKNQQMSKARKVYERLVQLKPNDQQLIKKFNDATALDTLQKGKWGETTTYQDLVKDPKQARSIVQENQAVKTHAQAATLMEETEKKVALEPNNMNYRRSLANLYTRIGQFDQAIETLDEVQQLVGNTDPQVDRLISKIKLSRFQSVIKNLKESGDTAGAEENQRAMDDFMFRDLLQQVRRYPNDLELKYELGVQFYRRGDINDAIQQFQAAQKAPTHRINALYQLALCFKSKAQLDIAREQLQKAAEGLPMMNDLKKDVLYELGTLSEAMNHGKDAIGYYKEIYAVDIGYKDITQKIEKAYETS